ncbi:mitochondrial carrier domain-containing protein [Xylariales sp. AK1849]|nr:mitochondrial carrier domain-containing protein [Xylariales sp. AK1849]
MSSSNQASTHKLRRALHHAFSGSAGTLISTCATYPLSLVVTRLQVQHQLARSGRLAEADEYAGIADALSRILWDGDASAGSAGSLNIGALYTGLASDAAKSVLDSFLFFLFYEWFRSKRTHARGGKASGGVGVLEELVIGVAAGACSRAFTTPIANVVTRKQTATLVDGEASSEQSSVKAIARSIMKEKGAKGFWSGYSASLVLTLNPSITFFLQEFLEKRLLGDESWDDPGPRSTFLLAAVSKAVASTITYPFQTAKARLQAGVPVESDSETEKEKNGDLIEVSEDDSAAERNVDQEVDEKLNTTRAVHKFAQQSIFGTVAQIVRKEGVGSLYDGIQGELLKGFFSHGTTMLAKDVIHKLLFKLYLVVAGVLQQLRLRRQQRSLRAEQGRGIPRALSFRPSDPHSTSSNFGPRSGTPSLISRFSTSSRKSGSKPIEESPGIILNLNDRTQRDFGKD